MANLRQARLRHAMHYEAVLQACCRLYVQGNEAVTEGLLLFDAESANFIEAQAWAATQITADDNAARLCISYADNGMPLLNLRWHPRERIRWLKDALAAARRLKDRRAEEQTLGNLGLVYRELGYVQQAIQCHKQDLTICQEIGDCAAESNALGNLGVAYADERNFKLAVACLEQQLAITRQLGFLLGEGNALNNLGEVYFRLWQLDQALSSFQEALAIAHDIGQRKNEAGALCNIGMVYAELGRHAEADNYYKQALVAARELNDSHTESYILANIGLSQLDTHEHSDAIQYLQQALKMVSNSSNRRKIANAYGDLGNAYLRINNIQQAVDCYVKAALIAQASGDSYSEAIAFHNMSLVLDALGDRARAISYARCALRLFELTDGHYVTEVREQLNIWWSQITNHISFGKTQTFSCSIEVPRRINRGSGENEW